MPIRNLILSIFVLLLCALSAVPFGSQNAIAEFFVSSLILLGSAGLFLAFPMKFGRGEAIVLGGIVGLLWVSVINGWLWTAAPNIASLFAAFCLFVLTKTLATSKSAADILAKGVLAIGFAFSLFAIADFFQNPAFILGFERPYHRDRLSAPFLSGNTAATFYGMITILAVSVLIEALRAHKPTIRNAFELTLRRSAFPASTALLTGSAVLLSGSRAGFALLVLSLLSLVVWEMLRRTRSKNALPLRRRVVICLAVATVSSFVFILSNELLLSRLEQLGEHTEGRWSLYQILFAEISAAPWLGHGLGSYRMVTNQIGLLDMSHMLNVQGFAHNVSLQWILQTGILGLAALMAINLSIARTLLRGLTRRHSQRHIIRAVLILSLFSIAHGQFDFALEIPAVMFLFTILAGLGIGVAQGGSRQVRVTVLRSFDLRYLCAPLFAVAGLASLWSTFDRSSAQSLTALSDEAFREIYADQRQFTGSHVRMEAIGDRALQLTPRNTEIASRAFQAYLDREPRDGYLWGKLGFALYRNGAENDSEAIRAFENSYRLAPYPRTRFARWRSEFIADADFELSEPLKRAANREAIYLQRPIPFPNVRFN